MRSSEAAGSAFSLLRDGRVPPLESYITNEARIRETLKAVCDEHCSHLALEKAYAAALEAEEAGEVCCAYPAGPRHSVT
jgi:hypothetical protein